MNTTYLDLPSPFGLAKLSDSFCKVIAAYDPDLVIFPSQKHPFYRLARPVRHGSVRNWALYKKLPGVTDDIRIMLDRQLIALPFALPAKIASAPPEHVVATIRARDTWAFGGPDGAGDRAADALEAKEKAKQKIIDDRYADEMRQRKKAAGIAFLYRTGARVSLVSPRRMVAPPESSTQTGPDRQDPAGCSTQEP